jgi:hypothetical protein
MDWRGQKASWFGALDAAGILVEAKQVTRAALPAWLATRLKAQEQSADDQPFTFIADKVEGNLLAAYQEVQKTRAPVSCRETVLGAGQGSGARRRALRCLQPRRRYCCPATPHISCAFSKACRVEGPLCLPCIVGDDRRSTGAARAWLLR